MLLHKQKLEIKQVLENMGIPASNVTELGSGTYGTAFSVVVDKTIIDNLKRAYQNMTHTTFTSFPTYQRQVLVLKFEALTSSSGKVLTRLVREAAIHAKVSTTEIRQRRRVVVRGKDIAPEFFFAGILQGYSIICMERVQGSSMASLYKKANTRIPRAVFNNLERLVQGLLRIGIVHGDLNAGNIFVMPDNSVKCIDFGFAFIIPDSIHKKAVNILNETASIEKAWKESGIQDIANARYGEYPYYHSNLKMLQRAAVLSANII